MKSIFTIPLIASSLFSLSATEQDIPPSRMSLLAIEDKSSNSKDTNLKKCGTTFAIYGEYLLLQPNGSDLYYAVEAIGLDPDIAVPALSPNWKVKEIDPDYHSGFEVGTRVLFQETDMNIKINWERLHSNDHESFTAPPADGFMVGPFFDIGPNSSSYKVAKGKVLSHFDEVDLNIGKHVCFNNRFYINFGGGLGFTRLKQSLKSKYSNTEDSISRSVKTHSTFIGAGPELAISYDYRLSKYAFFTGSTQIALFLGQLSNKTTFKSTTPELGTLGVPQPNVQHANVPNRSQVVPAFEQKVGFSFPATFNNVTLTFAAGYHFQIFINAIQTVDMTSPQVLPAGALFTPEVGVFAVGFERTLSNYMLTGPYVSLDIQF